MATHILKTWPVPFEDVLSGAKTAEVRVNDRNFQPGDELVLQEFIPYAGNYTGREIWVDVTHVQTGFGLPDGLVVLSIAR